MTTRVATLAVILIGAIAFTIIAITRDRQRAVQALDRQILAAARRAPEAPDPSCHQPIERTCGSGRCETYGEAAEWVRRESRRTVSMFRAHVGVCGTLRFVAYGNGFVSSTQFFNEDGKKVGARHTSDNVEPPCFGEMTFGVVMDRICSMAFVEDSRPLESPPHDVHAVTERQNATAGWNHP